MSTTVCLYFYAEETCLSEGMVSVYILLSFIIMVLNNVALNKVA